MQDRRSHDRVRSLLRAQIIFNNRMSTVDCVIKNISSDGAKLALGESLSLPNEFELNVPQKGRTFRARMTWRDAESVGVKFVQPDANVRGDRQDDRLRELELQNAALKARVRALSKRLEDLGQDPELAA